MIFNSVTYLIFLPLCVLLYWTLPGRSRLWFLLTANLTFYGFWRPEFLLVMIVSAATDYFSSLQIEATDNPARRRMWLLLSLTVNFGLLLYFKYLLFFVDNAVVVMHLFGADIQSPLLNIVLPLGISFYTFQTVSYTIDVYRGHIPAERNFMLYGCFVTFFPHLVAGPILRAGELLPQLSTKPSFQFEMFVAGMRRILFGLFLKVVLADNISPLVDAGFAMPVATMSALDVVTLAFLFGFQIYFDFSAYSHIAIGSARLLGVMLPENFNFPYMSSSPREFWRRWHITLSSWIRDYLYLPLLGAKVQPRSVGGLGGAIQDGGQARRNATFALFLTWGIMGFWHGANWTFIIWGLYHATWIAIHRGLAEPLSKLPEWIRKWGGWGITLLLAMLAWIPFRAATVGDTLAMFAKLFSPREYTYLGMRESVYLVAAVVMISVLLAHWFFKRASNWLGKNRYIEFVAETSMMTATVALVFVFLRPISQFIYFQF